jgi:hypothetical protein
MRRGANAQSAHAMQSALSPAAQAPPAGTLGLAGSLLNLNSNLLDDAMNTAAGNTTILPAGVPSTTAVVGAPLMDTADTGAVAVRLRCTGPVSRVPTRCWHCSFCLSGRPVPGLIGTVDAALLAFVDDGAAADAPGDAPPTITFLYLGVFCTEMCMAAYVADNAHDPRYQDSLKLYYYMQRLDLRQHMHHRIVPARPRSVLVPYGGSVTIAELRGDTTMHTTMPMPVLPSTRTLGAHYEERPDYTLACPDTAAVAPLAPDAVPRRVVTIAFTDASKKDREVSFDVDDTTVLQKKHLGFRCSHCTFTVTDADTELVIIPVIHEAAYSIHHRATKGTVHGSVQSMVALQLLDGIHHAPAPAPDTVRPDAVAGAPNPFGMYIHAGVACSFNCAMAAIDGMVLRSNAYTIFNEARCLLYMYYRDVIGRYPDSDITSAPSPHLHVDAYGGDKTIEEFRAAFCPDRYRPGPHPGILPDIARMSQLVEAARTWIR